MGEKISQPEELKIETESNLERKDKLEFQRFDGEEGFNLIREFMEKMSEKYINNEYPNKEIIERINPEKNDEKKIISYGAFQNNKLVGILTGDKKGNVFLEGLWFVIDPECKNREIGEKLWEMAFSDFEKITLLTNVFGLRKNELSKKRETKQKALIRYYEKMGFIPNTNTESFKYSKVPGGFMPMIWEKK
ncbi:MAG: hypothetical protein A3C58_01865 [Candidatus Staskawiczbacteria bacterium RIFCSPHIGHO2_02_FULL_34_10]|uniref:N-acetyltransferase domain-containing protein n=2 Tax=Candidatus Staskawicziibacteriota TaxID=1817916 RepID=A0A1G2HLM3_9BACT|nr:MAG: hypothetical protein A2639_03160 [Candidatus Staskawiczbacteria bacterium RIFCSPHIGHO2_01_FULL_34_27]OGZ67719.1 MAG: hypothetical protein A3C58_01865 [Candidatus Staskawiczbacteria bacterium RIFCSPHIGHO2_02_FULL_34_10]